MNTQEMQDRYTMLYETMKASRNPDNMKLFGHVMTEMMMSAIQRNPSEAQMWIDELGAIEWKNYLSPKEAEKIVSEMNPPAPWTREVWSKAMDSVGLDKEDEPNYNSCVLWVLMNDIYSNHSQTIAKIVGTPLDEIPTDDMLEAVYHLAMDKLHDKDRKISIRHMFGL